MCAHTNLCVCRDVRSSWRVGTTQVSIGSGRGRVHEFHPDAGRPHPHTARVNPENTQSSSGELKRGHSLCDSVSTKCLYRQKADWRLPETCESEAEGPSNRCGISVWREKNVLECSSAGVSTTGMHLILQLWNT